MNGDDFICGHERHLWSLHQEVLHRWGVYTIFQWKRMHVGEMKNELIAWFVPRESPDCYEIIKWLEYELEKEIREPEEDWPGAEVDIAVVEFSAIEPYVDRDTSEKMAQQFAQVLKQKLIDAAKKKKDENSI
jgi:hypothetical protein